jgi:hypothetical protein
VKSRHDDYSRAPSTQEEERHFSVPDKHGGIFERNLQADHLDDPCYHAVVERARVRLDPKTSKHRMLACAKCRAPVASSAWSGAVVIHCDGCGHEETRDLTLDAPSAETRAVAYREPARPRHHEGAPLVLDLDATPPGHSTASLSEESLYALLERQPSASEDFVAAEWERVWYATWLSYILASRGELSRARAALESTLEVIHTPAYRTLLLARLAQHAASLGATGLAKKFLKARPRIAHVHLDSEVRAARALIAYAKNEFVLVLTLTGDETAGAGFSGPAALVAVALNMDANLRVARPQHARQICRECARQGLLPAILLTMHAFRVNDAVITRELRRVRVRNAAISATIAAAFFSFAALRYDHFAITRVTASAAIAVVASFAWSWWANLWALAGSKPVRVGKKVVEWVGSAACVALPLLWLMRTSPPPPDPPTAAPPTTVTPSDWSPDP